MRHRILVGAAAIAATTLSMGATAATAASTESVTLEEVVVTARKQSENLQDVPLTVTALTAKSIEKLQIKSIFDLATVTPGLYYGTSGGRNGGNKLQIRNFSTGTAGPSKASVFIDGAFSYSDYSSIPLANLQRIEVLKGPQSAQFGRATFVGAVNFITRDPGNEFAGKIDVLGASEGEHDVTGFFSIPLISNKLAEQITFREYSFKGPSEWHTNAGLHLGDQSTRSISSKTVWSPTDNAKIKFNWTHVEDDDHIPPVLYADPTTRSPVARPNGTFGYYFTGPTIYNFSAPAWGGSAVGLDNPGIRHYMNRYTLGYEFDVGGGHTISGYVAHNEEAFHEQLDGSFYLSGTSPTTVPNPLGVPTAVTFAFNPLNYKLEDNDTQAELRFSSPQMQPLRYTVGLNYSKINGHTQLFNLAGVSIFNSNAAGGSFLNPATDKSIFGGVYWDATDKITLSAEGRYQKEEVVSKSYSTAAATYGQIVGTPSVGNFNAFLPRVNFQYKFNKDLQIYALYSEGNNPGGFQPVTRAAADSIGVPFAFDEEKIANYEAGIKSTWMDGRLVFNAAVFHMDFTHEQLAQTFLIPPPLTATGFASIYLPGVNSKVDGFELEANAQVSQGLQVRATVGYGKAVYKSFCSTPYALLTGIYTAGSTANCRSVAGKQQEGTPALQTSLSGDYAHPMANGWSFFTRGDWQYQSKVYNEEWDQSWIPGHGIANLRFGVENAHWSTEVFVRNLTDDSNTTRSTRVTDGRIGAAYGTYPPLQVGTALIPQTAAGQQTVAGTAKKPRQFGLRVSYQF
jgi:outer membrane receptor protein involved in Fe transport